MSQDTTTLDPKLDLVFCLLFGDQQYRELLLSLLNAVLQADSPVIAAESLPAPASLTLPLRLRLASGEELNVELQSLHQRLAGVRSRMLQAWSRLFVDEYESRTEGQKLRRCVVVTIANFVELPSPRFHSVFQVREDVSRRLLTEHLELHLIELPKLLSAVDRGDQPKLVEWCRFLAASTADERAALARGDAQLAGAMRALEVLSADEDARREAERRALQIE